MRRVLFIFTWLTLGALPAVAQNSLYADPRAFRQGDLLTIILAERTAAQRESNYEQAANTKLGGAAAVSGSLGGRFGLDATFVHEGKSRNETLQRDLLTGTVTAIVVGVDTTGNLLIEGERRLNVNGVTHLMRISGLVRPLRQHGVFLPDCAGTDRIPPERRPHAQVFPTGLLYTPRRTGTPWRSNCLGYTINRERPCVAVLFGLD